MKSFLTLTLIVSPVMVMADITASTNALELIAGTARRALQTSADACTSALDQVKWNSFKKMTSHQLQNVQKKNHRL